MILSCGGRAYIEATRPKRDTGVTRKPEATRSVACECGQEDWPKANVEENEAMKKEKNRLFPSGFV